ncbi:hypothetical protein HK101_000982 [Irineochytrium annulatum]|nr:hypothetical protein HK101_000982 [Irineochytrium annulatum]
MEALVLIPRFVRTRSTNLKSLALLERRPGQRLAPSEEKLTKPIPVPSDADKGGAKRRKLGVTRPAIIIIDDDDDDGGKEAVVSNPPIFRGEVVIIDDDDEVDDVVEVRDNKPLPSLHRPPPQRIAIEPRPAPRPAPRAQPVRPSQPKSNEPPTKENERKYPARYTYHDYLPARRIKPSLSTLQNRNAIGLRSSSSHISKREKRDRQHELQYAPPWDEEYADVEEDDLEFELENDPGNYNEMGEQIREKEEIMEKRREREDRHVAGNWLLSDDKVVMMAASTGKSMTATRLKLMKVAQGEGSVPTAVEAEAEARRQRKRHYDDERDW